MSVVVVVVGVSTSKFTYLVLGTSSSVGNLLNTVSLDVHIVHVVQQEALFFFGNT